MRMHLLSPAEFDAHGEHLARTVHERFVVPLEAEVERLRAENSKAWALIRRLRGERSRARFGRCA